MTLRRAIMRMAMPSAVMPHTPRLSLAASARQGPLEQRSHLAPAMAEGAPLVGVVSQTLGLVAVPDVGHAVFLDAAVRGPYGFVV